MVDIDFEAFDADNHYYEATDAFTRHIEPELARRAMQWATVNGKERLLVGGKINRFIPNPQFDPVAKPGALDQYFRGRNPAGTGIRELFGDLEPISPAYRGSRCPARGHGPPAPGGSVLLPHPGGGHGAAAHG